MNKPKVTIQNFSGMGENGIFRVEKMAPSKRNGQSLLEPKHGSANFVNTYSGLLGTTAITCMDKAVFPHPIIYYSNIVLLLSIDSAGNIRAFDPYSGSATPGGLIHLIPTSVSTTPHLKPSNKASIFVTATNDIVYTHTYGAGIGYYFTTDTGSGPTKLVAAPNAVTGSRPDFGALGLGSGTGQNKVIAMYDGTEYTITSVSTTHTTNDTLNVSGATTISAGTGSTNIFYAFVDTKFDFSNTNLDFIGQNDQTIWVRQMDMYGDLLYILNGNKLAMMNSDESTFLANAKLLPYKHQGQCIAVNQSQMAIGCEVNGEGAVCVWDGASEGWNYILKTDRKVAAITPYKSGWLYVSGTYVYYTNGLTSDVISKVPNVDNYVDLLYSFDAFKMIDNKLWMGTPADILPSYLSKYDYRAKGLMVYDFTNGWNYVSGQMAGAFTMDYNASVTSICITVSKQSFYYYFTATNNPNQAKSSINYSMVDVFPGYGATFYVKLPQKMKLSRIELSVSPSSSKTALSSLSYTLSKSLLTVSYGASSYQNETVYSGSLVSSTKVSLTTHNYTSDKLLDFFVGQLIRLDYVNSTNAIGSGARRMVTKVESGTSDTVTLTLDSALPISSGSGEFTVYGYKVAETKELTGQSLPDNMTFDMDGFYDDNLFIDVYFLSENQYGLAPQFDINGINIY